jgi:hypothetical protein
MSSETLVRRQEPRGVLILRFGILGIFFFYKGWFQIMCDIGPFPQEIDIPLIKDIDPLWFSNFVSQPLATHGQG